MILYTHTIAGLGTTDAHCNAMCYPLCRVVALGLLHRILDGTQCRGSLDAAGFSLDPRNTTIRQAIIHLVIRDFSAPRFARSSIHIHMYVCRSGAYSRFDKFSRWKRKITWNITHDSSTVPFENERLETAGRRRTFEFLYGTIGGRWNILRSIRYIRRLIAEWQADRY